MFERKKIACAVLASSIALSGCVGPDGKPSAGATMATTATAGAVLGGIIGSRTGMGGLGGALAGAAIGGAMGAIIHQLTVQEQQQREAALQKAARRGNASWASRGDSPKKATYQRVGKIEDVGGKKCQQVQETITLADGKTGTSTETVCFS